MNKRTVCLLSSFLLLSSCGVESSSSAESSSLSKEEIVSSSSNVEFSSEEMSPESKSSETVVESSEESSETVVDSSEEASSLEEESSESLEPSLESQTPGDSTWTLDYNAIPQTSSGTYNIEFDFSVRSRNGQKNGFHGSYLQRGNGSKEGVSLANTIQIKKGEGYFYTTTANCVFLRFETLRTGAYTGTPTLYTSKDLSQKGGEEVTLQKTVLEEQNIIQYEALIPSGKFRLENNSSYVLYLISMTNVG